MKHVPFGATKFLSCLVLAGMLLAVPTAISAQVYVNDTNWSIWLPTYNTFINFDPSAIGGTATSWYLIGGSQVNFTSQFFGTNSQSFGLSVQNGNLTVIDLSSGYVSMNTFATGRLNITFYYIPGETVTYVQYKSSAKISQSQFYTSLSSWEAAAASNTPVVYWNQASGYVETQGPDAPVIFAFTPLSNGFPINLITTTTGGQVISQSTTTNSNSTYTSPSPQTGGNTLTNWFTSQPTWVQTAITVSVFVALLAVIIVFGYRGNPLRHGDSTSEDKGKEPNSSPSHWSALQCGISDLP